jgi:hypothetical protein
MSEHLKAGYRELTSTRCGERNGHNARNLVTPAGTIEHPEETFLEQVRRNFTNVVYDTFIEGWHEEC